jgi:hypothetical protein
MFIFKTRFSILNFNFETTFFFSYHQGGGQIFSSLDSSASLDSADTWSVPSESDSSEDTFVEHGETTTSDSTSVSDVKEEVEVEPVSLKTIVDSDGLLNERPRKRARYTFTVTHFIDLTEDSA